MKIGYPCINYGLDCTASSTFRLKNYSEERLIDTVQNNLACLKKILEYNVQHGLYFFRISSSLVPFASHPICQFDWINHFAKELAQLGDYIKQHAIRISMHPDQFVLINAQDPVIVNRSIADLVWHVQLLDALGLDRTAKVQIHVGGIYQNKQQAITRFVENYHGLPDTIKNRLVIENDDRLYTLNDCLFIHQATGIPIIFDNLHHACHHNDETLLEGLTAAQSTWQLADGLMMVDYSSQEMNARKGKHTHSIDEAHFSDFITASLTLDFDIMLEIKDKEISALKALSVIKQFRKSY